MPNNKLTGSLVRSVEILKCFPEGLDRLTDICNKTKLSKSTVHRLLKMMESTGLVRYNPNMRRYYLGPVIFNLASELINAHKGLIYGAFEELRHLRGLSGETALIHIPIGLDRICLDEAESIEEIKYVAGKGSLAPIHVGAAGKMLLAQLDDSDVQMILRNVKLIKIGPNTITDTKKLLAEIQKIRKEGFAISIGERLPGAAAISVAINNYCTPVSISIMGPEDRLKPKMMNVLDKLKKSAIKISKKLTF